MTSQPLNIAFVWHMHQPFYKDMITDEYVLPWVRLHAIKDYYDMAAILDDFKDIKQTFNLVPSLLEQIEDYVNGGAMDKHLKATMTKSADLSNDDKVFILQNFFMANWETMIDPYKRYHELLLKRGRFVTLEEIKSVARRFTDQEFTDLQVWSNLSWFGHIYKTKDPVIKALLEKGRNFTEEDKIVLVNKQKELMSAVLPKYKELQQKGQIEITVTPYYHPILPLLIDTNSAKEALPSIKLPQNRFRHPEDAAFQVNEAVKYMKEHFGIMPSGMWPSEGSVSEDMLPLIGNAGIKWIATDEGVLLRSLVGTDVGGRALSPQELFSPYLLRRDNCSLNIIFRDHGLSDLIGFVYSKWNWREAVSDFMNHLNNIKRSLPDDGKKYLVSIILDGENAWEYYKNNGWDFLRGLYERLSKDGDFKTVRVGDFLAENPQERPLHHLFSGSWIDHNFRVWIGHEEDNKAWDYLNNARLALESSKTQDATAWKELYIAEGSDWCWWFGDDHSSENDETFDQLFRKHLKNIYHIIGKASPQYLDVPIKQVTAVRPTRELAYLIKPVLDGEITNYYEWLSAGYYDIGKLKGAMHQSQTLVKGIYYGFDIDNLYVRLDVSLDPSSSESRDISFVLTTFHPHQYRITASYKNDKGKFELDIHELQDDHWKYLKTVDTIGIKYIVEVSVPFSEIKAVCDDDVQFVVTIDKGGQELERWPRGGSINFRVPPTDYEERQWSV
ncbi:MAG: glycoside hydrolase family 57 protein [bacterium]